MHLLLGIAALIIALVLPLLLLLPLLVLLLLGLCPLALESTKWIAWILELLHIALAATALVSAVLHICALLEGYSAVATSSAASSAARPASALRLELALLLLWHPILLVRGWRMPLLHLGPLLNLHSSSHVHGRLMPHLLGRVLHRRVLLLWDLQRICFVASESLRHLHLQGVDCCLELVITISRSCRIFSLLRRRLSQAF